MNVVPVAGDGDGDDQNDDYDEANVFQPEVLRRASGVKFALPTFFSTAAGHRIILAESKSRSGVAAHYHDIHPPV